LLNLYATVTPVSLPFPDAPVTEILVNIEKPELNREVVIFKLERIHVNGTIHDGFQIVIMNGDYQHFEDDKYSAHLIGANQIMVTSPSMPYLWLNSPGLYTDRLEAFGIACAGSNDAHSLVRTEMRSSSARQVKRLLLTFPSGTVLSNHIYSPNSVNGEIEVEAVPVTNVFMNSNKESVTTQFCPIYWNVSTGVPRVVVSASSKASEKLTARLQGVQLSNANYAVTSMQP
jgi:hypothetical protein